MEKKKIVNAYCVIPLKPKAEKVNNFVNGIKVDYMGTLENPYFSIHPKTKKGLKYAKDNCNGYEQVAECQIVIKPPVKHKCNCNHCNI